MYSLQHLNYSIMVIVTLTAFLSITVAASRTPPKPRPYYQYLSTQQNTPISSSKISELIINIPHNEQVLIEIAVNSKYSYEALYQQYGIMFQFNGMDNRFSIHSTQLVGTFIPVKLIRKGNLSKDSSSYPNDEDEENDNNKNATNESYSIFIIPLSQKFVCPFDCFGNGECQTDNTCQCKDTYTKESYCQISKNYQEQQDKSIDVTIQQMRRSSGVNADTFNEESQQDKNNNQNEMIENNQNQSLNLSRHSNAYTEAVPSEYLEQVAKNQSFEEIKGQRDIENSKDQRDTRRILLLGSHINDENVSKQNILEQIQESNIVIMSAGCLMVALLVIAGFIIVSKTKKQNQLIQSGNDSNDQFIYSSV